MARYVDIQPLLDIDAHYRLMVGERSNGKSYAVLKYHLEKFVKSNYTEPIAIIRRWEEDFRGANSQKTCYDSLMYNGEGKNIIKEMTDFDGVEYYSGRYYMTRMVADKEGNEKMERTDIIIGYAFSINNAEHYKGAQFPTITTILFDEFISDRMYLPDEFTLFMNLLSTIIRQRDNLEIFMCANTISMYNPYMKEMGLTNFKKQGIGTIDVYNYGKSELKVALFLTDSAPKKTKKSNVYFAFNNPKLNMITGGDSIWQIGVYPHSPIKFDHYTDVLFKYWINFDNEEYECEVVQKDMYYFTYIHPKTSKQEHQPYDIIFDSEGEHNLYRQYSLLRSSLPPQLMGIILDFYKSKQVCYSDNTTGSIIENYLEWCKKA